MYKLLPNEYAENPSVPRTKTDFSLHCHCYSFYRRNIVCLSVSSAQIHLNVLSELNNACREF